MLDPNTNFLKGQAQALPLSDHSRQTSRSHNSYFSNTKYGVLTRKTSENYANYRSWNDGDEGEEEEDPFRAKRTTAEDGDSGASTPPLWNDSNTPTPASPQHRQQSNDHLNYRTMSPNSRSQAIARGQKELMDFVSRMPEGCYELSLKDIVEHPVAHEAKQESSIANKEKITTINTTRKSGKPREEGVNSKENKKNYNKKAVKMNRSGSLDNGGLFLKMVFPVSFGSKKAKLRSSSRNNSTTHVDGSVSPRPLLGEGSSSNYKGVDHNEWWRKGLEEAIGEESNESVGLSSSGKSGSSKSTGSSSSRSSSRSSNRHANISCWSCFFMKKGKRAE